MEDNNNLTFQLSQFNAATIGERLMNKDCNSKDDCLNIGECDKSSHKCIFKDIYCSLNNCFQDNGCDISYINNPEPQYLKSCEMNPYIIFETCIKGEKKCKTRYCYSNEQCLSNLCIENKCISNINNPIYYCSNIEKKIFKDEMVEFSCTLNYRERCNENNVCNSKNCGILKNSSSNETVCLEPNTTYINILAGLVTYTVVIVSIVLIYGFYKRNFYKRNRRTK
ncbi:hypothetical protein BCR36DRAFT_456245 [Piromyces finnis]|uniref:Uncharacterized protein n=1 Tax=Piromyces finnis TaxID=1754191 RepID=A0A1Y1V2V4_9FUNG|nr:hypothetical protein BCR36DRAFT_456245 [Piromyces finnis]|eukprot:ORX45993.1 hypothetical protein BCR36DRAFT_456245 [Piromyces finnis]